jgi:hypothetical protein
VLAGATLLFTTPGAADAQGLRGHVGFGPSALSTPGWSPAYGPSVGIEFGGWLGTRVRVDYRSAARDSGEIVRFCGFASCTEGPFDREHFVRSLGVGFSRRLVEASRLELAGVLRARFFQQGRHLTHLETGEELDRDDVIDYGLGVGVEARLASSVFGVHPMVWLAYDRLLQRECPADGSCYHDRNHLEAGLGLSFGR